MINHPLGGGHPDAVLFSTHVMREFGGVDAVRHDFGGFLMAFSAFIDEHLEFARTVVLSDIEHPEAEMHRTADGRWEQNVDWTSRPVLEMLSNPKLTSKQVARQLGCESTIVRTKRRRMGIDVLALRSNQPSKEPKVISPEERDRRYQNKLRINREYRARRRALDKPC